MDKDTYTGILIGVIGIAIMLVLGAIAMTWQLTKVAMLDYWLPGAERQGAVVIYQERVLTPENVRIVFDDEEPMFSSGWVTHTIGEDLDEPIAPVEDYEFKVEDGKIWFRIGDGEWMPYEARYAHYLWPDSLPHDTQLFGGEL